MEDERPMGELTSSAGVATREPGRYLRQLCEHFADPAHRHGDQEFDVRFDDRNGAIDFAPVIPGTCTLDATHDGILIVSARAADAASLERIQRIVTRHLERFGAGAAIEVNWEPQSEVSAAE